MLNIYIIIYTDYLYISNKAIIGRFRMLLSRIRDASPLSGMPTYDTVHFFTNNPIRLYQVVPLLSVMDC